MDNATNAFRSMRLTPTPVLSGPPSDLVCKFFLRGTCTKGDSCRFIHPAAAGDAASPPRRSFAAPSISNFVDGGVPVPRAREPEEYVDFASACK